MNTRGLAHHRLIAAVFVGVASAGAQSCSNDPVKVDVENTGNGFVDLAADPASSSDSNGLPELDDACLSQTAAAEQRKVALNVMLDSSGSMEEPTGSGATKWQAVQRAIRSFFRKGNLLALRELALRRTAERVDEQMRSYRREHGIVAGDSLRGQRLRLRAAVLRRVRAGEARHDASVRR